MASRGRGHAKAKSICYAFLGTAGAFHAFSPTATEHWLAMESPQKAKALSQIGPWRLEKTIGRGSTGKVKAAFNAETGEKRACKVILASVPLPSSQPIGPTTSIRDLPAARCDDSKAHGSKEFRIIREAAVLLLLDHPHVIQMHEMHMIDGMLLIIILDSLYH